ncbi:unnamed protein product, partial [Brachionus calyciflorus]
MKDDMIEERAKASGHCLRESTPNEKTRVKIESQDDYLGYKTYHEDLETDTHSLEKTNVQIETPKLETSRRYDDLTTVTSIQDELTMNSCLPDEPSFIEQKDLPVDTDKVENRRQISVNSEVLSTQLCKEAIQHFCSPCVDALFKHKQNQVTVNKDSIFKPDRFTKKTDIDTWWTRFELYLKTGPIAPQNLRTI